MRARPGCSCRCAASRQVLFRAADGSVAWGLGAASRSLGPDASLVATDGRAEATSGTFEVRRKETALQCSVTNFGALAFVWTESAGLLLVAFLRIAPSALVNV